MAEDATVAFEQAKDMAVRACLADMLDDVEHALCKFSLGLYGTCERCGRQIDWARLEAKPEARLCIKCQQKSEWRR
jgi:DnaK suppressor protein